MPVKSPVRQHPLSPRYEFDPRTGRYHNKVSKRFVENEKILRALDYQTKKARQGIMQSTQSLIDNQLSLKDWRAAMVTQIRNIHISQYAMGKGGWAHLQASDYGQMGAVLQEQFRYLNGFVHDLQSEMFHGALSGRAKVRAGMYANAAYATYQKARRLQRAGMGMREERRVLGHADHCVDCLEYAGRGWQPMWTLPPIGHSLCKSGCHCEFEYR